MTVVFDGNADRVGVDPGAIRTPPTTKPWWLSWLTREGGTYRRGEVNFFALAVVVVCLFFVWSTNPVHGVLTLVALGLAAAGALLGCGLEFAGLVVVLVYVGAVTVLFVFVVMMVNLRATPASYVTAESWPVWTATAAAAVAGTAGVTPGAPAGAVTPGVTLHSGTNLVTLGTHLYGTDRVVGLLTVGLVLFVAMISAIALSLVAAENYRTQEYYSQIRKPNAVFVLRS